MHSFNIVDTTGSGTITINALQRVLTTTSLPAADIDKVGRYSPMQSPMPLLHQLALTPHPL